MKLLSNAIVFALLAYGFSIPEAKNKPVFMPGNFNEPIAVAGKEILLTGIVFPTEITVIPEKNVLMFLESSSNTGKKYLHIYSLDSLKPVRAVIDNGPGEGQILGASKMQYDSRNGGEVYITDARKRQIFVYKVDSLIAGKEWPFKIIGKPFTGALGITSYENRLARAVVINSEYDFIDMRTSIPNSSRMLLNKYRSDFSVKDSFGVYPKTDEEIQPDMLSSELDGTLNLSTNKKNVVFCGVLSDYLAVYDTSGKLVASAIGTNEVDLSYKTRKTGGGDRAVPLGRRGYDGTRMNKGLIYALYVGKASHIFHTTTLLRFNAKLQPEERYNLSIPVYAMDFDWRTKRMYALSTDGSIPKLVVFQM